MKKIYIFIIITVLIFSAFLLFRNGKNSYQFVEVEKSDLTREIFESGVIKKGEEIRLGFKETGRIESVLVKEGEKIFRGTIIATLDKKELELSLKEAKAGLVSAQASMERLLRGATIEELNVAESAVKSSETTLSSAENNLKERERIVNETLRNAYQNVGTLIGNVFSIVKETETGIQKISENYFTGFFVSETNSGRKSRDAIKRSVEKIEDYKNLTAEKKAIYADKEEVLKNSEKELRIIIFEIDNIINVADSDFYRDKFSDADKEILREYRKAVNKVLAETISLLGSISSVNAETNAELTGARATINSAKSTLDQALKEFSRINATPDSTDVIMRQAVIDQAKARIEQFENRIENAILKSPVTGTVSSILIKEKEIVSLGFTAVVVVSEDEFQVEVNIYEGDMPEIALGNPVVASFLAFPDKKFMGEVISINPVGRIIDGVVYYPIKIILEEYPQGLMTEMTVDVSIKTSEKKNVLVVPEIAVFQKKEKSFVKILENDEIKEVEVKTGMKGDGRRIEIISGVKENDKILLE